MNPLPYMPFFVSDYLSATGHLSTPAHGAYMLLIMSYWQMGKPLPDDDRKLARIARMTDDEWMSVSDDVREFFNASEGKLIHSRVEQEIETARAKLEQARNAGKASAQRRFNGRSTGVQPESNQAIVSRDIKAAAAPLCDEISSEFESECEQTAGFGPLPGFDKLQELVLEGFDQNLRIIPIIRTVAEDMRKRGKRADSWLYFIPAIKDTSRRSREAAQEMIRVEEGTTLWTKWAEVDGEQKLKATATYRNGRLGVVRPKDGPPQIARTA